MDELKNQWLWFLDDELLRGTLALDPDDPELARRAAAHPAVVKAVRAKLRGNADEALNALAPALADGDADAAGIAAQIHFEAGRMAEAAQAFDDLSQLRPGAVAPVFNRGLCLARLRRWAPAVECFQKAVLLAPSQPDVWHGLGISLLNQRRGTEARAAFAQCIQLRPDYAPAWFGQAVALQLEQKHEEALEIYEKLLEEQPGREELLANALMAAVAAKESGKVHALSLHLLGLRPGSIPALLALAAACAEEQNFEDARRWCSLLIELEPASYDHWYNLGLCRLRTGDVAGAQEAFAGALRLNSEGLEAWTGLARCAAESDRPDLAMEAWRAVVRLDPENADAWFALGIVRHDAGDLAGAAEAFERAASLRPDWQAAWLNLGACRWADGDGEKAEAAFEQALEAGGDDTAAAGALVSLAAQRGDLDQARRRRRQWGVTDPRALFDLGALCQAKGLYEEAAEAYSSALRAQPVFAEASFNLGSVLLALGRGEESPAHWKAALSAAPELARNLIAAG